MTKHKQALTCTHQDTTISFINQSIHVIHRLGAACLGAARRCRRTGYTVHIGGKDAQRPCWRELAAKNSKSAPPPPPHVVRKMSVTVRVCWTLNFKNSNPKMSRPGRFCPFLKLQKRTSKFNIERFPLPYVSKFF